MNPPRLPKSSVAQLEFLGDRLVTIHVRVVQVIQQPPARGIRQCLPHLLPGVGAHM